MTVREPLTPRELECIEAVRKHGNLKDAADSLEIEYATLRAHLASARSKRGVKRTWMLFIAL